MNSTIEITKDNFQKILNDNEIVLLDFWASWCGPCRSFSPIFEKVASKNPDIKFGKINTELEQELAGAFNIRSIPTLMVFRQNIILFSQAGVLQEQALQDLLDEIKSLDMEEIKKEMETNKDQKEEKKHD